MILSFIIAIYFSLLYFEICGAIDYLTWSSSKNLSLWYSPFDLCLLRNNGSWPACENVNNNQPIRCTLGNSWPSKSGFCSAADLSYDHRVHLRQSVTGFDDPSQQPLKTLFGVLSKQKGSVVLIGDSVMQQFFSAMACELEREGIWKDSSKFTNTDEIKYVSLDGSDHAVPIKFTPIYHFVNGRYDRIANASMNMLKKSVESFARQYDYVVIIINMGLHYVSSPMAHFSRRDYYEQMTAALKYLHGLAKAINSNSRKMRIFWRETSAQHFPTPNGYWPGVRYASSMKVGCVPIKDTSTGSDWRNSDIKEIIANNGLYHIWTIPFYQITVPLWTLHVNGYARDCTHFCFTPMLYQSTFHHLTDMLK